MICPYCGSESIDVKVFQENNGSESVTAGTSRYKESRKHHGVIWWLLIGWWWWIVDVCLWIFWTGPRLIIAILSRIFKKKEYTGASASTTKTNNNISYKTICLCKDCGRSWSVN